MRRQTTTNHSSQTSTLNHLPGLKIEFVSDIRGLANDLTRIFSAATLRSQASKRPHTRVSIEAVQGSDETLSIVVDGESEFMTTSPSDLLNYCETLVTGIFARHLTSNVLVHSGAVERNGVGILLPAASGAGKSTTTTALALNGFRYLSDEMAVLDTAGTTVFPFPKMPSLKPGGRELLVAEYGNALKLIHDGQSNGVSYVDLPVEGSESGGTAVKYILLLGRRSDGKTVVSEVKRSEALKTLVRESLDLAIKHRDGFDSLFSLTQNAECFRVEIGDIASGVEAIRSLVDRGTS